ncbi:MAG: hypothetical protein QM658_16075 [Gordonia sp. (in: high G+C Gram-positive bacteria)]
MNFPAPPLIGGLVGGLANSTRAVAGAAVDAVIAVPRGILHAVLDEVFAYLRQADLTSVLVDGVDLNRVLAQVDLDALLAGVDLNALLSGVDLNALLADVDLNALLADVDLNSLLASLDLNPAVLAIDLDRVLEGVNIDAVLDRTDLVGVAGEVVDGIDLNSIVRDASASVTTEMITDVRSGSERADDRVDLFVSRMLRRRPAEQPGTLEPEDERQ